MTDRDLANSAGAHGYSVLHQGHVEAVRFKRLAVLDLNDQDDAHPKYSGPTKTRPIGIFEASVTMTNRFRDDIRL